MSGPRSEVIRERCQGRRNHDDEDKCSDNCVALDELAAPSGWLSVDNDQTGAGLFIFIKSSTVAADNYNDTKASPSR